jgi:hypothetical protein
MRVRNTGSFSLMVLTFAISIPGFRTFSTLMVLMGLAIFHAFSLDRVYSNALIARLKLEDLLIIAINCIPYVLFLNLYLLIPVSLLITVLLLPYLRVKMWPAILGSTAVASLYLPWVVILKEDLYFNIPLYLIWILYSLNESLYVEYKLPYRKVEKAEIKVLWLLSLLAIVPLSLINALILLTLIEPSLKYFNPGSKLEKATQLRELGHRGLISLLLLTILIIMIKIIHNAGLNFGLLKV